MRFPEFEGEWEEKKLGEIAKIIGGGTPDTSIEEYWNGEVQWFTPSEIKSIYVNKSERTITELGLAKSSAKLLPVGTVLITTRATIGEVAIANIKCCTNQGFQSLVVNDGINNIFIANWIKQNKNELIKRAKGSTFAEISKSEVEKILISIPNSDEQNKIALFLFLLDQRIETQNKIIEELKLLKSTISANLFNKTIRMDKSLDSLSDWKIVKLSDVLSIPCKIKPISIDKSKLLTVKLHLKGVTKNNNTETLSIGATNYYIRKKGQFIYGKQNLFNGAFSIIPDSLDGYLSSGDVPTLDVDETKIDSQYLMYYLGREHIYKQIEKLAIGSGSKRVHESTLLNLEIPLPSIEEQSFIVKPLFALDKKIAIEENILFCLLKEKAYFLHQMFI